MAKYRCVTAVAYTHPTRSTNLTDSSSKCQNGVGLSVLCTYRLYLPKAIAHRTLDVGFWIGGAGARGWI
ncbi:MAG: hypothetical protein AAGD25_01445 [Cyanobacteria bacterium P01_F01_bin.150]